MGDIRAIRVAPSPEIPSGFVLVYEETPIGNVMLVRKFNDDRRNQDLLITPTDLALTVNAHVLGKEPPGQRVPLPRGEPEVGRRAFEARFHVRDRLLAGVYGRQSWRITQQAVIDAIREFEGGAPGGDRPGGRE